MEKIWLNSYPSFVPPEINPDAFQSIVEIFQQSCQKYGPHPAYYNYGASLTYQQIEQYSQDVAAYLQKRLVLEKGERIAIMLPNVLQYPVMLFGALRAGLIVVNVNPLYTPDELIHQLNDAKAKTIVILENFAATLAQALPKIPMLKNIIITKIGDFLPFPKAWIMNFALKYIYKKIPAWKLEQTISFQKMLKEGRQLKFTEVSLSNQDIAFLQYTGGTTGISKAAMLTHRNIIANLQQADAWFKDLLKDRQEIIITALPLYHIFSLMANCLVFFRIGGLNILITNPHDIGDMIKTMSRFKFTVITGVNTLFNRLLKNSRFKTLDFSALHLSLGGGMAVQKIVAEKWETLTHVPLLEAYGLTETSPCVSINPTTLRTYNGTVGLPVPSTDIRILDANGNEVKIGEAGELAVKGPQVMQGYWCNPAETKRVFTADGWLLTGDIAAMDASGYLRILERKKDMILVSGFNVYPNEIEDVIARCQGVREVAVIGIADENTGEAVKAFVVKDNPNLTQEDIIHFCHEHLTHYKTPKYIEFRRDLPKTNVGKILRRALKESK